MVIILVDFVDAVFFKSGFNENIRNFNQFSAIARLMFFFSLRAIQNKKCTFTDFLLKNFNVNFTSLGAYENIKMSNSMKYSNMHPMSLWWPF